MQKTDPATDSSTSPIGSISHQASSAQSRPWRPKAVIANSPGSPWRRRSRWARMPRSLAPAPSAGLLAAHLDVLEPPGDLGEGRVDDQLPRRAEGAIGPAGQVGQVREQARVRWRRRARAGRRSRRRRPAARRSPRRWPRGRRRASLLIQQVQDARRILGWVRGRPGRGRSAPRTGADADPCDPPAAPRGRAAHGVGRDRVQCKPFGPATDGARLDPRGAPARACTLAALGGSLATRTRFRGATCPRCVSRRSCRGG